MNLWLSPHGIWYYRKVTTLPCGRRKEIKKIPAYPKQADGLRCCGETMASVVLTAPWPLVRGR
ncbi:hypothetical protein [Aeromonas jandaei]|uniref:hypothetical protein n=1 Tax=Aeromonas jandaei TaxID=650 RepID=UPI0038B5A655